MLLLIHSRTARLWLASDSSLSLADPSQILSRFLLALAGVHMNSRKILAVFQLDPHDQRGMWPAHTRRIPSFKGRLRQADHGSFKFSAYLGAYLFPGAAVVQPQTLQRVLFLAQTAGADWLESSECVGIQVSGAYPAHIYFKPGASTVDAQWRTPPGAY